MNLSRIINICLLYTLTIYLSSCGGESQSKQPKKDATTEGPKKTVNESNILKVGDKLFNLPSPIETAMLIEEIGGDFMEQLMSPAPDATKYSTKNAEAMNLGVYGADLGYTLIYNQSQKALTLLANCKKLGGELGISPSRYTTLMKRFESNMDNRDSLLIMIAQLNSLSDEYLKDNESEYISALILYGGWIESLYFTTQLTAQMKDTKLRSRVGEQKNSLENLIGLIDQSNIKGELDGIIEDLKELKTIFDKVEYSYEWAEPETKPDQKLTIIQSKSSVNLSDEVLKEISDKILEIRASIINTMA